MKKVITTIHTIIVILGLITTAAWSGYYLYNQRHINTETNAERLPAIVQKVSGSFALSETLYDKSFGENIKQIFTENKDIIALSIYSYDKGIEYFYSRNGQIQIINESSETLQQSPRYKGLSFSNSIGSVPLQIENKPGSNIDVVFTVLPRTSVFYVLKISLLAVIILFIVTLILIIAFSLSKDKVPVQDAENDWEEDISSSTDNSEDSGEEIFSPALETGFEEDKLSDERFDDNTFDAESPIALSDSDFSLDSDDLEDDFGLDSFDNSDDTENTEELDELLADDDFSDNMNLEDSIPDIPDEEDLMGMDHEELPSDDFDFPEDDNLFEEMSSDDLDDLDELDAPAPVLDGSPTLYNPETGLGWESFLDERLGLELERSASFDQDLVLVLIRNMSDETDMEQIAAVVREEYSYHDLIFEAGNNSLAMIEPNKDLDEAISDAQNLIKKLEQDSGFNNLKCGLSSRNGRLITGKRLIKEADTSLNKADEENPIVGFRSDPEKFRAFLNKNS